MWAPLVKSYLTYFCRILYKIVLLQIFERKTVGIFGPKFFVKFFWFIPSYSHSNVPFCTLCEHFRTFCTLKNSFSIASKKFEQQGQTKNKENHVILGRKEVQIVYRLFLVNCYLLHVPEEIHVSRLPFQPASSGRGWVIDFIWLELP